MSRDNTRTSAFSWAEAKRRAREQRYHTKIEVPKETVDGIPSGFDQSLLSIPNQAKAVYRDQQEKDSFQIREYDDRYTIEMDKYNPEQGHPIEHAIADAPKQTAAAAVVAGAFAVFS